MLILRSVNFEQKKEKTRSVHIMHTFYIKITKTSLLTKDLNILLYAFLVKRHTCNSAVDINNISTSDKTDIINKYYDIIFNLPGLSISFSIFTSIRPSYNFERIRSLIRLSAGLDQGLVSFKHSFYVSIKV